jgi:hypothetical protein
VGAPQRLTATTAVSKLRVTAVLLAAASVSAALGAPATYTVSGNCRDARPHGAYELRMADGRLRVAGAFSQGKRIGSFLFWSATGARLALLPFDDDEMNGTVALWHAPASAKAEPLPRQEALYAGGRLVSARSWHPDGRLRAEFKYDGDRLAEARAFGAAGKPLPEAVARALAARDKLADEKFYESLLVIVRDHPPVCDATGRKP